MKIVMDANIPAAQECFGCFGEVVRLPGREITATDITDADALIVRSVTPVTATMVSGSRLTFVGSCTIGTDHVDQMALTEHGVTFASAPGCNAEAVVDYVLSSLLSLAERDQWQLSERRVGIVGVGNVGGRLQERLRAMGVATLACDPPRAAAEGDKEFVDLDTLIEQCDVICLHTPAVQGGKYPTHHLLDARRIEELKPGCVVLNAGRGDCIDGLALRVRLAGKGDITAVLDVWEHEPRIDVGLRDLAAIATPHIAGYSLDGKLRGSWQVHAALARHLDRSVLALEELLPPPAVAELNLQQALAPEDALRLCARAVYDVRRDHDRLHWYTRHQGIEAGFDHCRAHYPLRREFSTLTVGLYGEASQLKGLIQAAGFQTVAE
ncbi:4-phosphoerythronate dehydrogenase PdxB [Halomonas sp. Bachu 37]|uniref:4-phosphoerythronate dehydrogenase PdxB n=1 Tax=Halomonas kashgarensis TaxID=3084920 RepID=UPI003217249C